jgi:HlyD family secretion protein
MTTELIRQSHCSQHRAALWRMGFAGLIFIGLFAGIFGYWAAFSTISGAVVAPGQFQVATNVKKVQHQTGGIVKDLFVREGEHVHAGQMLIRLDDTLLRANLQILTRQLDEFAARSARLQAERDGVDTIKTDADLVRRRDDLAVETLIDSEQTLFQARRSAREGQRNQLEKRIGQLNDEISGLKAQQVAKDLEMEIAQKEMKSVKSLFDKNLIQLSRLTTLEREAANLQGAQAQLVASVAQTEGKIAETKLQIIQIDENLRADAMKELREIQSKDGELRERLVAAADQLRRVDIVAPTSGYVHELAVHTIGGVVMPGDAVMTIVPDELDLHLEAKVAPSNVDQLARGQNARVKIQAFNQRTTPELYGIVEWIAADVSKDTQPNAPPYYLVQISLSHDQIGRLEGRKLLSGMQAEAFIETEDRSPLEYLMKPVQDQIARAFRER